MLKRPFKFEPEQCNAKQIKKINSVKKEVFKKID